MLEVRCIRVQWGSGHGKTQPVPASDPNTMETVCGTLHIRGNHKSHDICDMSCLIHFYEYSIGNAYVVYDDLYMYTLTDCCAYSHAYSFDSISHYYC